LRGYKPTTKKRPLVGVEISDVIVRIVEVRYDDGTPQVTALGAYIPPPGTIRRGRIEAPEQVGAGLRRRLSDLGVSTSDAIVGVAGAACVIRNISLPPAPDPELRTLIDGEVEHFQVFKHHGGAYDYFRLQTSSFKSEAGVSTMLFGIEGDVLEGVKAMASAAGIRLVAVEPVHLALYRTAFLHSGQPRPIVYATLSDTHADLALIDRDQVAIYRSFDLGTNSLFGRESSHQDAPGGVVDPFRSPRVDDIPVERMAGELDLATAGMLAVEIRRTVDYMFREMSDPPSVDRMVVTTTDPAVQRLAVWLENVLQFEVDLVTLGMADALFSTFDRSLSPDDAIGYSAAYGLAIRNDQSVSRDVPRLDLAMQEQIVSAQESQNARFRILTMVCGAFMLCAIAALSVSSLNARNSESDLQRSKDSYAALQKLKTQRAEEQQLANQRLTILAQGGIPVTGIMSEIARSLPVSSGLTEVRMNNTTTDVAGEALAESSMIQLSQNLRQSPLVHSLSLTTFERIVNDRDKTIGVRFRLSANTGNTPAPGGSS